MLLHSVTAPPAFNSRGWPRWVDSISRPAWNRAGIDDVRSASRSVDLALSVCLIPRPVRAAGALRKDAVTRVVFHEFMVAQIQSWLGKNRKLPLKFIFADLDNPLLLLALFPLLFRPALFVPLPSTGERQRIFRHTFRDARCRADVSALTD